MIKVLIVDDHALFRSAMARYLTIVRPDYKIHEAGSGESALEFLSSNSIDIVLMDIQMPGMNGLDATKLIKEKYPSQRILILSQLDEPALVIRIMELGVNGFVCKTDDIRELEVAIECGMRGGQYLSPSLAAEIHRYERSPNTFPSLAISRREYQILDLIVKGMSNREMAYALKLEVLTIESYRKSLMSKTKASNVADLVSFAFRIGLGARNARWSRP
jgi:DNA-binding NarL/FixJ family response regulator